MDFMAADRGSQLGVVGRKQVRVRVVTLTKIRAEALTALVVNLGFEAYADEGEADVALYDLTDHTSPYPDPLAVPTLAISRDGAAEVQGLLDKGYRGCLGPQSDSDALRRALETVQRGEIWQGAERSFFGNHL